jgi:cardiolipin synthase
MTDGKVSSFGTANMDIRSFELNFEVNAVIYDEETTKKLEALFIEDLKVCKEITRESYGERSIFIRIKEQGSRLLSPLL